MLIDIDMIHPKKSRLPIVGLFVIWISLPNSGNAQVTPDSLENLFQQAKNIGFAQPDRLSKVTDALLAAAEESRNTHYMAEAYNLLGGMARFSGQYEESARDILQAYEYFLADGDKDGQARTLSNLGSLYYFSHQYNEGLTYSEAALKLARGLDDPNRLAVNLLSVGLYKMALSETDTAILYLREAENLLDDQQDSPYLSAIYNNLGKAYLTSGELDRSLYYYMEGQRITQEMHNEYSLAYAQAGIASVYAAQGHHAKATPLYKSALEIAEKGNWHQEADQFAQEMAKNFASQGNYAEAYHLDTIARNHQNQITMVPPISLSDSEDATTQTALKNLLQRLSTKPQAGFGELPNWALGVGMGLSIVVLILGWILLAKQTMIGKLERSQRHLKKSLQDASMEKSNLAQAKNTLADREDDVDHFLKFKNQLYQVLVYELRDPLVGLLSMQQQILDGEVTGKERRLANMEAQRHLQSLYFILQATVLWVRMQDDGIRPGKTTLNCESMIEDTVKQLNPLATGYDVKINLIPNPITQFASDRDIMQHILQLMLFNGIRFADKAVNLRCYAGENRVIFAVETNRKERNELISDLWNQSSTSELPNGINHSTTGLTLWLAHQLTLLLGGQTREEYDPDRGQILKVAIPLDGGLSEEMPEIPQKVLASS